MAAANAKADVRWADSLRGCRACLGAGGSGGLNTHLGNAPSSAGSVYTGDALKRLIEHFAA